MFERFTDRARRVVVLAQEEALIRRHQRGLGVLHPPGVDLPPGPLFLNLPLGPVGPIDLLVEEWGRLAEEVEQAASRSS